MKKLFLVLLVLLFANSIKSQAVSIGIKSGANISSFHGKYYFCSPVNKNDMYGYSDGWDIVLGKNFGILFDFGLTKKLSLQTEVLYEDKGFKYFDNSNMYDDEGHSGTIKYKYITMPLILKYKLGKKKRFNINTGIYLGKLLYAREKGRQEIIPYFSEEWDIDIKSQTHDFDFGLSLGLGYETPVYKKIDFLIEPRVNYGLTENSKTENNQYKNFSVSLGVGVKYNIKR